MSPLIYPPSWSCVPGASHLLQARQGVDRPSLATVTPRLIATGSNLIRRILPSVRSELLVTFAPCRIVPDGARGRQLFGARLRLMGKGRAGDGQYEPDQGPDVHTLRRVDRYPTCNGRGGGPPR